MQRLLRVRARPKILLSRSFEEAFRDFKDYRHTVQGVISDVEFPRGGEPSSSAGVELTEAATLDDGAVWDLAVVDDVVIAATGSPATLHRVSERGLERWIELPDDHARSVAVEEGGRAWVGTSGKGLIVSVADSRATVVADSPFTEISDLALDGDGRLWAAALVGDPSPAARRRDRSPSSDDEAVLDQYTSLASPSAV